MCEITTTPFVALLGESDVVAESPSQVPPAGASSL